MRLTDSEETKNGKAGKEEVRSSVGNVLEHEGTDDTNDEVGHPGSAGSDRNTCTPGRQVEDLAGEDPSALRQLCLLRVKPEKERTR